MTGSIICGVDDSPGARRAARVARELGRELRRRLLFVRVIEPDAAAAVTAGVAERLERLRGAATDVDCGATWLVEVGDPADRLVATAVETGASLIVVGSTAPRSSLLGGISVDVARRAPCPVLVVPPGAGAANGQAAAAAGIQRLGTGTVRAGSSRA